MSKIFLEFLKYSKYSTGSRLRDSHIGREKHKKAIRPYQQSAVQACRKTFSSVMYNASNRLASRQVGWQVLNLQREWVYKITLMEANPLKFVLTVTLLRVKNLSPSRQKQFFLRSFPRAAKNLGDSEQVNYFALMQII